MSRQIQDVLEQCRAVISEWRDLSDDDFDWEAPKGFSSFTMAIRAKRPVEPPAVLYRSLAGKDNAILDFETEKEVFLLLGEHRLAARTYHYDDDCRIEEYYAGRTLTPEDLTDPEVLKGIAVELHRLHQLRPGRLPEPGFFELLHAKWSKLGRTVLVDRRDQFPPDEQAMCNDLLGMYSEETSAMVQGCLPDGPMVFCHNDTYHGNVMKLADGQIKLLDFEFSCLNHRAFDFSNLFAETVMKHGFTDPPHFNIAHPEYTRGDIAMLVGHYLDCGSLRGSARDDELERLVRETGDMILLSHYMYAMAGVPLAVEPIQKIRFIPYAHARWTKFQELYLQRFG